MPLELKPSPIRKMLVVPASVERAFDVFVGRMHEWSPAVQSLLGSRRNIVIEPRTGGRWYEVGEDGATNNAAIAASVTSPSIALQVRKPMHSSRPRGP